MFNPPYSKSVTTRIGPSFWHILDTTFSKKHTLNKIFYRNKVKVSHRCKQNFKAIINDHNMNILATCPSWFMFFKLPKIVHLLQICADLSKKPKSIKEIYFYLSERPHHALSENSIFIGVRATVHVILRNKISKKYWLSRNFTKFINFKY